MSVTFRQGTLDDAYATFVVFLMAAAPLGRYSHYIVTGPPLFV